MAKIAALPGTTVLITRLARAVYRRSTEEVLGMRLRPYVLLVFLRDRGPLTQSALGEALMLDANNIVLLLNELESAGYARRVRDSEDRRRHNVELTDAGAEALDRAEVGMGSVEDDVLSRLSRAERKTLRQLLEKALEDEDL